MTLNQECHDVFMSRPLRIEYADAWYHVMNRGMRREEVFTCKKNYKIFAVDRMDKLIKKDSALHKKMVNLISAITKSQE